MKLIIAIAFFAFLASSALAQGWYQQQSHTTAYLPEIFFIDKDTGWVAGPSGSGIGLYGTVNGGSTWLLVNPAPTHQVRFIDGRNGWVELDSSLMKTTDGGKTGIIVSAPINGFMQIFGMDTIRIFNADIGSSASSNDGGKTWVNPTVGFKGGAMHFASSQIGFGCGLITPWFGNPPPQKGTEGADFEYTIDGGLSWHAQYCSIQENLDAILTVDSKNIFSTTDAGNIVRTANRGMSWDIVHSGNKVEGYFGFYFVNQALGYAVGAPGKIIFTADSGNTWNYQNSTVTSYLEDVNFVDSLNGWACGDQGVVLHTINGGTSWVRQYLPFDSVVVQSFPEPASSLVSIHYTIPSPQLVSITLYDLTGHFVQTFIQNDYETQGEHTIPVTLTPQLANGVYYYIFQTEQYQSSGKITIFR